MNNENIQGTMSAAGMQFNMAESLSEQRSKTTTSTLVYVTIAKHTGMT